MNQFKMNQFKMNQLKIWQRFLVVICTISLSFALSSCGAIANPGGQLSDSELEQKVLEVIRKNPQVILESVQKFQQGQQNQQSNLREQVLSQIKTKPELIVRDSPVTGASSRKLVLAEFSDFQCPFCARAQENLKQFMQKYGNEVTLTFKHFPLTNIHPLALPAAKASWAASKQAKFWEYHDALFEGQKDISEQFLLKTAETLKLDLAKFNSDRNSKEAEAAIAKDVELAQSLGINGTPYFIFNGNAFSGVPDLAQMETLLTKIKSEIKSEVK
jgi:protein-disulfide isomerase